MTTCIAVRNLNGYVVAADQRLSNGPEIVNEKSNKIIELGKITVAFAGNYSMYQSLQFILNECREEATCDAFFKRTDYAKWPNSAEMESMFSDFVRWVHGETLDSYTPEDNAADTHYRLPETDHDKTLYLIVCAKILNAVVQEFADQYDEEKFSSEVNDYEILVATPWGIVIVDNNGFANVNDFVALGSGRKYAMGSMFAYLEQAKNDLEPSKETILSNISIDVLDYLAKKSIRVSSIFDGSTNINISSVCYSSEKNSVREETED